MTPRDEVIAEFTARGEEYKLRLIADMPEETQMGLYYHQDYLDMCRGPHVPNTKFLKSFKLTKISGAYWRGDAKTNSCNVFMVQLGRIRNSSQLISSVLKKLKTRSP